MLEDDNGAEELLWLDGMELLLIDEEDWVSEEEDKLELSADDDERSIEDLELDLLLEKMAEGETWLEIGGIMLLMPEIERIGMTLLNLPEIHALSLISRES